MWYVIQVINGREDVMRERIERMVRSRAECWCKGRFPGRRKQEAVIA